MSQNPKESSPQWHISTKMLVALFGFFLLAVFLFRIRSFAGILVVSIIVYFLMTPLVRFIERIAKFSWAVATNISFLFLLMVLIVVFTALGLAVAQQLQSLFDLTQDFFTELPEQLETVIEHGLQVGPLALDFSRFDTVTLFEQAAGYIDLLFSSVSAVLLSVSSVAIETVVGSLIVLIVAYFLTLDNARLRQTFVGFVIPGYEDDIARLRGALSRLWKSFLGGQLVIVLVTGVLFWLIMSALGMRFSLGLGVIGGLARFIPFLGPLVAGILAGVVALVQPSNWFGLAPGAYAALVILFIILLNQFVDYFFIPRILGTSLGLPPAIVLIATLLGAVLAGALGLLLAAPIVASIVLLGRYIFRKMTDQSPWDPPIDEPPEQPEPALVRFFRRTRARSQGE